MSAIGTIMVGALAAVGAVTIAKKVRRVLKRDPADAPNSSAKTIDLEIDQCSGVWRDNKSHASQSQKEQN